ncbi:MAG: hypothetical protein OEM38_01365 [Gammaproteobacteria bacterium]|nr:hypothetical protein [Gammaproteobacteria bacterium]
MKNLNIKFALLIITVFLLGGCASFGVEKSGHIDPPEAANETLIWSSSNERPSWTMDEPEKKNNYLSFVGLSATHTTEKGARTDARRSAVNNISSYIGTLAKDKFQNAYLTYGLDSSVMDPTSSSRQFGKQLTANIVSRVKTKKWYSEKWSTETGIGYRVFVLAKIPEDAITESYKDAANRLAKNAQNHAVDAANETAKRQAELASEFWRQMESEGLVD